MTISWYTITRSKKEEKILQKKKNLLFLVAIIKGGIAEKEFNRKLAVLQLVTINTTY